METGRYLFIYLTRLAKSYVFQIFVCTCTKIDYTLSLHARIYQLRVRVKKLIKKRTLSLAEILNFLRQLFREIHGNQFLNFIFLKPAKNTCITVNERKVPYLT